MISRSAYLSLAGIVAFATATFAADAPAQAPDNAGVSVRADPTPAPNAGSLPDADRALSGNLLWAIPLKQLSDARERPIFSPTRRLPPAVVVDRPFVAPVAARVQPKPAERPALTLLGTIAGEGDGLALFMETNTQVVIRLRTGEAHQGWVLRSVHGRAAMLEKDNRTETVTLPDPGGHSAGEVPQTPQSPEVSRPERR
jgi:hypothetical protein